MAQLIPYYLRPAEYEKYLAAGGYPYAAEEYAPVAAAQAAYAAEQARLAAVAVAKPFPWKWVIFGGIGLLVVYSIVKK